MTLAGMRMSDEQLAEYFEIERPRLRSIAYRILGTPDDADDVVQDSWLRFSTADDASIENPAAWLTTVASRLAIDRLRSARHRRETYVGPWLADPIASEPDTVGAPDDALILAESLSLPLGFLAVFKRLTPLERAVHVGGGELGRRSDDGIVHGEEPGEADGVSWGVGDVALTAFLTTTSRAGRP